MKTEEVNSNKIIVQHNNIINGHFDVSSTELKVFLYMLSRINKDDTEFKVCKIPISLITKSKGGKTYKLIRQMSDTLLKKTFKLETLTVSKNKEVRTYIGYTIYSKSRYVDGENHLEMKFNNDIKDYLLNLKGNFTTAEWEQFINFKSVHSYRIYWLLKQYQTFGERTIGINELKDMLMLKKNGKYMYSDYTNFKLRILDMAQSELLNTDMAFYFDGCKKGKAVYAIHFKLHKKKSSQKQIQSSLTIQNPVVTSFTDDHKKRAYQAMLNKGISEALAHTYLESIAPKFITQTTYTSQLKYTTTNERRDYVIKELDNELTRLQFVKRKGKIKNVLDL
jgi:plasmid replication initiation protein